MVKILFLFIFMVISPVAYANQALVLSMVDDDLSVMSYAILKKAYAKIDIDVSTEILPAQRALAYSSSGRTDGEVHRIAGVENKYPTLIRIPVSLNALEGIAFSCRKKIDTSSWDKLEHLNIGVKIGIRYAEKATVNMPNVYKKAQFNDLFDLLFAGGLDVVIASKQEIRRQRLREGSDCLVLNKPALERQSLYHYLHENYRSLVPEITKALKTMSESGEFQSIRNHVQ